MKELKPDTAGNTPELILRLSQHWLTEMICDHKRRTDQALCFCGWRSEIYYSVGGAVVAWAEHVSKLLRVAAPSQEAANIYGDAFNLIGLLRSVVACGEKLNKDDDAEISRVLHALRVERDKAEPAPSPATKDTPRTYWCCKADFGEHEPDCPNAAKSISQGPAREETPRIYAVSRASLPARPAMWKQLRSEGFNIISSWIDEAEPGATADLGELWERIYREIASADGLVLYAEEEDFPLKGALIEAGIAIGMGKPVHVVSPNLEFTAPSYRPIGSWITHPSVTRFKNLRQACKAKFDAGAQSRTPTNLESRTVAPQLEKCPSCNDRLPCGDPDHPVNVEDFLAAKVYRLNSIARNAPLNGSFKQLLGIVKEIYVAGAAALQIKTEDSNVSDMRESRSDTRDVAATVEIGMAFSGQDRSGHVQAGFQGTRIVVEGAAALPATPIEDIEVLEQAADYLRQLGGGPMEDRLRLLHERLAASVPAASSPTTNCMFCGEPRGGRIHSDFERDMPHPFMASDSIPASSPEPNQGCAGCADGMPLRQFNGELWHIYEGENAYGKKCSAPPVASQPAKEED